MYDNGQLSELNVRKRTGRRQGKMYLVELKEGIPGTGLALQGMWVGRPAAI
jgi:hypothetical protein